MSMFSLLEFSSIIARADGPGMSDISYQLSLGHWFVYDRGLLMLTFCCFDHVICLNMTSTITNETKSCSSGNFVTFRLSVSDQST